MFELIVCIFKVNMTGLTGIVEFDSLGFRTNFGLDIVELNTAGLSKVGSWSKNTGTNYTRTPEDLAAKSVIGLRNQTLIVSFAMVSNCYRISSFESNFESFQNDPYIMLKESAESLTGNDQYEGFCIDLLNEIAQILGFTYILRQAPNNGYGSRNQETGEWNGMIRELLEQVSFVEWDSFISS